MEDHDRDTSSTNSGSSSELTTKRFYLSDELKQEIKNRAESNYSGNASQLIRAAIHDHFSTLDGDSDRRVAHQTQEIENLQDEINQLAEAVQERNDTSGDTIQQGGSSTAETRATSSVTNSGVGSNNSGALQSEIYSSIENAESNTLTITELTERTDGSLSEVAASAEELVGKEILRREQDVETHSYLINTEV